MAKNKSFFRSTGEQRNLRFGEVSIDILTDILFSLNNKNKSNLESSSDLCGFLKETRIVECVFLLCEDLGLNLAVAFHAIEILERFTTRHIEDLFHQQNDPSIENTRPYEDLIFQTLKKKFFLFVFSSVQIASKLDLYSSAVNNDAAMRFLQRVSYPVSKQQLLDSEIFILKTLKFRLNVLNPVTYTETLLEVLGHNNASVPVEQLHPQCVLVLQFLYLQREAIYHSLLVVATGCPCPSQEQKDKFVSVMQDFMLLGVGVIAVAAFIHQPSTWDKVVEELTEITGISGQSIMDFAYVTLMHITGSKPK
ncbi:hypothetical protein DNTS_017676 [Danionella cerebrum]|uniref:Cyclin N-terminal domain-containing protein n=1 Tax=Danionella cerebrum TaxID=2873325 RepID=A0A553RKQ6_9TELE|nr:hypothetical protein DNTS_017676 [Danionella translucida]